MSAEIPPRVARGLRVRAFRDDMGWKGREFAERLQHAAEHLGFTEVYDMSKISKIENGTRDLSPEDVAVLRHIDPQRRDYFYWFFGVPEPRARPAAQPIDPRAFEPAKRARGGSR